MAPEIVNEFCRVESISLGGALLSDAAASGGSGSVDSVWKAVLERSSRRGQWRVELE